MSNVTAAPGTAPEAVLDSDGMERNVGFLGLLWASEGSIIGSGWLFGALDRGLDRRTVGDHRVVRRVVDRDRPGARARGARRPLPRVRRNEPLPALRVREPGRRHLRMVLLSAGGQRRADRGSGGGPVPLHSFSWAPSWYSSNGTLSGVGILVAVVLMFAFVIVNLIGIGWLARVNNSLTTWKVLIPVADDHHPDRLQVPQLQLQPTAAGSSSTARR